MTGTLNRVERRRRAVLEVLSGMSVTEVSRRYQVSRQTLYRWRARYQVEGVGGLDERSRRPHRSPSQLNPTVESLICALRSEHPGWGSRRLVGELARRGVRPVPSHSTVHRVLVRNDLVSTGTAQVAEVPPTRPARTVDQRIATLEAEVRELSSRLESAGLVGCRPEP